jgi:transposase InsO family protein
MDSLTPKDHAEAVALFRSQVLGALLRRKLQHGELAKELVELSTIPFRPPGSDVTRSFSVSTLERWLYAYKEGGLDALVPKRRRDKGRAQVLTAEQKTLLLAIRREHRSASASLILRTLVTEGRLAKEAVSPATLRRLYAEHGLERLPRHRRGDELARLRWEASRPNVLWQGDVCHGPALKIKGKSVPLRIHALIDDASRFIVGIAALSTERESDMLGFFVRAIRSHGLPETLYLDNGPTYTGDTLRTVCSRLGVSLVHPRPRDPQAKGKVERFFRTLRQGCLDHLGQMASLHDVSVRILAFIDGHYHVAPHASLMGKSPLQVWTEQKAPQDHATEDHLREAFTMRGNRRIRNDNTLSVGGLDWQLDQSYLAGHLVQVARCLIDPNVAPWVEHDGKRLPLVPVDPKSNAHRTRPKRHSKPKAGVDAVRFDPTTVLLEKLVGRTQGGAS